ncbi:hypothetical protein [Rubritalea sp.]|uniref:hypothetical protein n=1 Tax=Rubritalea sp. TaxID=2109375 RepID=UPI003EF37C6E
MKHKFGTFGILVGLIALCIAIFQNDLRPEESAPIQQPEPTLKELAVEASKKLINDKILKEETPSVAPDIPSEEKHDAIQLTYMALGFLAIVLGAISWIRKDHIRLSGGAISLGIMAVAWQYVLIGITVAVIILIIANIGASL